jgi:hypothetical protein
MPYKKDTVANNRFAVNKFAFIFHKIQLRIINLTPIVPLYTVACCSIQNKEGQTTELPLKVQSYITVCSGRWIEIHTLSKCRVERQK